MSVSFAIAIYVGRKNGARRIQLYFVEADFFCHIFEPLQAKVAEHYGEYAKSASAKAR